jgi:hypothetical protein
MQIGSACMQYMFHACNGACKFECMHACRHANMPACMPHACGMHAACMHISEWIGVMVFNETAKSQNISLDIDTLNCVHAFALWLKCCFSTGFLPEMEFLNVSTFFWFAQTRGRLYVIQYPTLSYFYCFQ